MDSRHKALGDIIKERAAGGSKNLPKGVSESWYNSAIASIEASEFYIRTTDLPGSFAAVNHPQHLGYLFTDGGYLVKNFNDDGSTKDTWQARFQLAGIGRSGRMAEQPLLKAAPSDERSLRFDHGDYAVSYHNEKAGMEQVFVLRKRPEGRSPLVISMNLSGDLAARLGEKNQLLLYRSGHPDAVKLVYDQVVVLDNNKHRLPVRMSIDGNNLKLTIDDRGAAYPVVVDPLNHTPTTIITGNGLVFSALNDVVNPTLFGFSSAGAGDVNGDGFGDIIVGAPLYVKILTLGGAGGGTFNLVATGAAFIFYGSLTGLPTTPSKILQPSNMSPSALFGFSVSGAGDVNHDGKADVIIGAPGDTVNFTVGIVTVPIVTGKVYIYSGATITAAAANTIPAVARTLHLTQADFGGLLAAPPATFYGWSVGTAGDVNNDGFADILIGIPLFDELSDPIVGGRVDVYQGSSTGIGTTPSKSIFGNVPVGLLGWSVSTAGDVNHDGFSDIILGAPGTVAAAAIVLGTAYVYHGSAAGIVGTSPSGTTPGPNTKLNGTGLLTGTLFGFSVSNAGDVNGDTYGDVIVGEPLALDGAIPNVVAAGKAYVFYGSGTGIKTTGQTLLRSPRTPTVLGLSIGNLLFGYSVSGIGDINSDGFADVIVGEPGSTALSSLAATLSLLGTPVLNGAAYIFYGAGGAGITTNVAPTWTLKDVSTLSLPDLLGMSVHGSGDVNGDGVPDFLVGSTNGSFDLSLNLQTLVGSLGTGAGGGIKTSARAGNLYAYSGLTVSLPVTLLSFTGREQNGGAVLNWSTAMEENSSYFEVQRSTQDSSNFVAIGKVTAAHNSNQVTNYTFTDATPASGDNYYRLKQVDLDGNSVYTYVVLLNFSGVSQQAISVYPNPAHESFQLQFKNMATGRYEISVLTQSGQQVLSKVVQVSDPVSHLETLSLPALAPGTYLVRIVDPQQKKYINKLLVQ